MFGGPVPDALTALSRLLATLHDDAGDVAVDGLVGREGAAARLPRGPVPRRGRLLDGVQLIGSGRITDRIWTKPAISVLGIDAPPHRRGAERAGPGREGQAQRPARARRRPQVGVRRGPRPPGEARAVGRPGRGDAGAATARPCVIDATGPAYDAARAAFRAAWDGVDAGGHGRRRVDPVHRHVPGAVPGGGDPGHRRRGPARRAHGPNESLHLGEFARVCLAEALLLAKVAEQGRQAG